MSFLSRFRRTPDLKQDNLLGLRDDLESQSGPASASEQAAPAAKMEAAVEPAAAAPASEMRTEMSGKEKSRMSIGNLVELGEQRTKEAQARRAESRAKWAERRKNFGALLKSGIKIGRALYHVKGELAGEMGTRAKDYGTSKSDQISAGLEEGYNAYADMADQAYQQLNQKVDQAYNFVMAKLDEMKEKRRSTHEAALLEQRKNAVLALIKINAEVRRVQSERGNIPTPELSSQAA